MSTPSWIIAFRFDREMVHDYREVFFSLLTLLQEKRECYFAYPSLFLKKIVYSVEKTFETHYGFYQPILVPLLAVIKGASAMVQKQKMIEAYEYLCSFIIASLGRGMCFFGTIFSAFPFQECYREKFLKFFTYNNWYPKGIFFCRVPEIKGGVQCYFQSKRMDASLQRLCSSIEATMQESIDE